MKAKRKLKDCFKCCLRNGLTLVEVVVGLLLLSTLLVFVMMSSAQFSRQIGRSSQRMVAIESANRLLAEWFASPDFAPRASQGTISGNDQLQWYTQVFEEPRLNRLGIQILRLEIRGSSQSDDAESLAMVEVVVNNPQWTAELPDDDNEPEEAAEENDG